MIDRLNSKVRSNTMQLLLVLLMLSAGSYSWAADEIHGTVKIHGLDSERHLLGRINLQNTPEAVAHELRYLLEQSGYILAVAKITNKGGIIVSYGAIKEVSVVGFSHKVTARIHGYFSTAGTEKPNINNIDRALALVNDIPGVAATVAFRKIDGDGNFEAVITGIEERQSGQVYVDSVSRTPGGDTRYQIFQNFNSAFTGGDLVRLQGSFVDAENSPNQRSIYGSYTYPLTDSGTYLELSAGDFQSEVPIEGTATIITTKTGFSILPGASTRHDCEGQSASLTVGHPFIRTHDKAAYVLGSIDWSDDETAAVGDSETMSGDVSVFYREENPNGQSYAVGATLGLGHADSFHDGDTGDFGYLQGSLGVIIPLEEMAPNTEFRFELFGQVATTDTPSSKLIGLGSEEFLRGYENSTFIGSTGLNGSLEIARSFYAVNETISVITPFAFFDFGTVRNDSSKATTISRPESDSLASAGIGLRMSLFDRASVEGFVGQPLMEDVTGKTPSPRLYMRLGWGW